jgi:hypothetical protein
VVNLLADIFAGSLGPEVLKVIRPTEIEDRSTLLNSIAEHIYHRDKLAFGQVGLLLLDEDEWKRDTEEFEPIEAGQLQEVAGQHADEGPLEFIDAVRIGPSRLLLPSDTSREPELAMFEFVSNNGEMVMQTRSASIWRALPSSSLVDAFRHFVRAPASWFSERKRRRCPIRTRDLGCSTRDCQGTCAPYKLSGEDRTLTLCTCVWT